MITLTTGVPGSGKTLRTLVEVRALAEKESRQVYYAGIKDLMIPGWVEIDAAKWFDCPVGAIIVIDECQTLFRPRGVGSQVPDYVAKLETHRHNGHDLFLVTQHPMLVDSNVRRLVGRHLHVARRFGMARATVLEFPTVREQPTVKQDDAVRHEWAYPKEAYTWYKSAEVHTHKARIPFKVWLLLLLPIIIGALVWFVWSRWQDRIQGNDKPQQHDPALHQTVFASGGQPHQPKLGFIEARTPRVPGLVHTAPAYDELTKPTRVPVPAACVEMRGECRCYTQDGTRMPTVPGDMCRQIVRYGYFEEFPRDSGKDRQRQAEGQGAERQAPVAAYQAPEPVQHDPIIIGAPTPYQEATFRNSGQALALKK